MNTEKTYYETMLEVLKNPPLPQKPKEKYFPTTVAFLDSDATEEEVREYLREND